jgi:hypothetical protein
MNIIMGSFFAVLFCRGRKNNEFMKPSEAKKRKEFG